MLFNKDYANNAANECAPASFFFKRSFFKKMIGLTLCLRTLFYFYFLLVPQLLLRTDAIPVCWVFRQTPLGKSSSSSNSNNLKVQRQSNCPLLCFTAPISSSFSSFIICYYYGDEANTVQ